MTSWGDFADVAPNLAEKARALFFRFGPGLGFVATVDRLGAPRVHPICPVIAEGALYAFIQRSPKLGDLMRDGRYALHSFPQPDSDDGFLVKGRASHVTNATERVAVEAAYHGPVAPELELFRFDLEACLHTEKGRDGGPFRYRLWPSGEVRIHQVGD
jgi:hypothetical protein